MNAQIRFDFARPVQACPLAGADNPAMPGHPALAAFHPAVAGWFARTFPSPTEAQQQAWPATHGRSEQRVA